MYLFVFRQITLVVDPQIKTVSLKWTCDTAMSNGQSPSAIDLFLTAVSSELVRSGIVHFTRFATLVFGWKFIYK